MDIEFFFMVELGIFLVDSLLYESHDGDETKYWQNGATCCTVLE